MTERTEKELEAFAAKIGDKVVKFKNLPPIIEGLSGSIARFLKPMQARIAELEKVTAEMQAAQAKSLADFYRGVWQPAGRYERGDVVTWQGGMWIAFRSTETKPGDGDSGWQLAVKAGRDGRNAK
jgi:hypothetical protein